MVALRASRLVCSAIEVMTLTTLPISAEESPSLATVSVGGVGDLDGLGGDLGGFVGVLRDLADRGAESPRSRRRRSARCARPARRRRRRRWPGPVCAASARSAVVVPSNWSAAAASEDEVCPRVRMASRMLAVARFSESAIMPTSSRAGTSTTLVRSPSATAASTSWTRRSGRTMSRTIHTPMSAVSDDAADGEADDHKQAVAVQERMSRDGLVDLVALEVEQPVHGVVRADQDGHGGHPEGPHELGGSFAGPVPTARYPGRS